MKNSIHAIAFLVCLIIIPAGEGVATDGRVCLDTIIPDSAMLVFRTTRLERLLHSVHYVVDTLLHDNAKKLLFGQIDIIKTKTGIDFFNERSLKEHGIDSTRDAAAAFYASSGNTDERLVVYIPVLNEKLFPLQFVEILRKLYKNDADIYPVITSYGSRPLYQFHKDIFGTTIDGNFVMSSHGDLIKKVIDLSGSGGPGMMSHADYKNYRIANQGKNDIEFFCRRQMLISIYSMIIKSMNENRDQQGEGNSLRNESGVCMPASQNDQMKRGGDEKSFPDYTIFNSVEYCAVGLRQQRNRIACDITASFNRSQDSVNKFIDSLKTNLRKKAVYNRDANTCLYFAIDLTSIDQYCRKAPVLCRGYYTLKNELKQELDVDVSRDFIPLSTGIVNIIMGSELYPSLNAGSVIYLPMKNAVKARVLWDKTQKKLKASYEATGRYAEIKTDKGSAFWYINEKNIKRIIAVDLDGLYIGSHADLVKICMDSPRIGLVEADNEITSRIDDSVFLFAAMGKNSFIMNMLTLMDSDYAGAAGFLQKIRGLLLIGKKIDTTLVFTFDVEFDDAKEADISR